MLFQGCFAKPPTSMILLLTSCLVFYFMASKWHKGTIYYQKNFFLLEIDHKNSKSWKEGTKKFYSLSIRRPSMSYRNLLGWAPGRPSSLLFFLFYFFVLSQLPALSSQHLYSQTETISVNGSILEADSGSYFRMEHPQDKYTSHLIMFVTLHSMTSVNFYVKIPLVQHGED